MSEHHTTVTVNAPAHQVYEIFTHFNDFPKFMSFVKEVTYYDQRRSHWVAQVAGTHEWDAVNEDWVQDQQIGWRSTNGLQNSGRVKFTPLGAERTQVDVFISYTPPAGLLGAAVDSLGFDSRFDASLQKDLEHFARLVEQAPAGSLDPMQSHYIFHPDSAVAKGVLTERQQESMNNDPMMTPQELQTRNTEVERAKIEARQARQPRSSRRHVTRKRRLNARRSLISRPNVNVQDWQRKMFPFSRNPRPLADATLRIGRPLLAIRMPGALAFRATSRTR